MSARTLLQLLESTSTKYPEKTSVVVPDVASVSYKEFVTSVHELKQELSSVGVGFGDVVVVVLPNNLEFLTLFFAITATRATAAPLNPAYKTDDFTFYMKDTEAKARFVPCCNLHLGCNSAVRLTPNSRCNYLSCLFEHSCVHRET